MKTELNYLKIATPFVWAGFIGAISFMEAWLKFTAAGVTLATGLSIGKVVFDTLNKVEILFGCLVMLALLLQQKRTWTVEIYYFLSVLILVVRVCGCCLCCRPAWIFMSAAPIRHLPTHISICRAGGREALLSFNLWI